MSSHEDSDRFWDIVGDIDSSLSPVERAANDAEMVGAYLDWWERCTASPENYPTANQILKEKYAEISMRYGLRERDYLSTLNLIAEHLNGQ